jgi:hypothetical protein
MYIYIYIGVGGGDRMCHIEASAGMMKLLLPDEASELQLLLEPDLKIKEYSGTREVCVYISNIYTYRYY